MFDYWFVQFDFPVALATSYELDSEPLTIKNSKPYKSSGGKMVFNEELDKEIPDGWAVEKFESLKLDVSDGNYSGKYPKAFKEKYKEHNPEKYGDTISHVIQKGSTPAGMHIPIMVEEILNFLDIKPGQIGLDATLGYGGHTQEMLKCLKGKGHMYALDIDPVELPRD